MNLKITLATATALGLMMGSAWANDGNEAFTSQDGENNILQIQQSAGTGNNRVGTSVAPILQQGDGNTFRELQFLGGGAAFMGSNVIEAGRQLGNNNSFGSSYSQNNSGNNLIGDMLQQGNSNIAGVSRNAGNNGEVGTLHQIGNSNSMGIGQTGAGNEVTSATQTGSNNGSGTGNRHNHGMYLSQNGANNLITEASIEGSNNVGVHPTNGNVGGYAVLDISQSGNGNGSGMSTARMIGSQGNQIVVNQNGDSNQFNVLQGQLVTDTQNSARLFQTGSFNEAMIDQRGSDNTALMTFNGDSNGLVGMTGVAGTLVSGSGALIAGQALQDSSSALSGNSLTYAVVGSSNKFAFAQIGGSNTISGLVGDLGTSNGNQVAVLQTGSNNNTVFSQNGNGNNASFSQ